MVSAQTAQCLSLSSDLGYGMKDNTSNGPIIILQQYLTGAGYLSATPTGYFGSATLAAVEAFQNANNISSIGYVGPLTRAAIGRLTCTSGNVTTVNQIQTQTVPTTVSTNPMTPAVNSAVSTSIITTPSSGQILPEGRSINVTLASMPYARYDIVLLSPTGSAGFIAQSLVGTSQYLWTVGNVFSSQTQSNQTVTPGSYQIRIQNSATGAEPTDPISNPFTISAASLNVSVVFPTSIPADGSTAAILYGSGFNLSTLVGFTNTPEKGQVLYVSPDGRVLVFTVPIGTNTSSQSVYVTSSSGVSSNKLPFDIISP